MKEIVEKIIEELKLNTKIQKTDVHTFDSGAYMIDIWKDDKFYCIQLFDNKFGLSEVDKYDFSTIPDFTYETYDEFKFNLNNMLQ
ncbi:hypothetical protein [Sabulibacter ruber]|uniref:hypothetical protein n=1 Tax=Sabulibacter ruber TaxID=2811901 RepID=UPI001A958413|nr:hypothetical protein [Sabulibacter ruber]